MKTTSITLPTFLDIEASGLGRGSYPIEIGIVSERQQTNCFLIRPDVAWLHWDMQAEQLHGLSRAYLQQMGLAVSTVAESLNQQLYGKTVYSDGWAKDYVWLACLFECAGMSPRFRLESVYALLSEQQLAIWEATKQVVIQNSGLKPHRACADALILQKTYLWTLTHDTPPLLTTTHAAA